MSEEESYKQAQKFILLPRCVNCDHCNGGRCAVFEQDIPEEYLHAPTECEQYLQGIPF